MAGVSVFSGWWFCLREGERDWGVDQVEGSSLGGGWFGEGGHDGAVGAVAEVVAGEGGQVVEQAAEAADGLVVDIPRNREGMHYEE